MDRIDSPRRRLHAHTCRLCQPVCYQGGFNGEPVGLQSEREDYACLYRLRFSTQSELSDAYDATRTTSVLAQSELLPAAEQPLDYPLYGTILDLETVRDDLSAIQAVAVTGSNPRLIVNAGVTVHSSVRRERIGNPGPGSAFTLMQPPPTVFNNDGSIPDWSSLTTRSIVVADPEGRPGTVEAQTHQFHSKAGPVECADRAGGGAGHLGVPGVVLAELSGHHSRANAHCLANRSSTATTAL